MTELNEIELNQTICTIAGAMVAASQFPGVEVKASESEPWTYDVRYPDHAFDHLNVSLEHLRSAVAHMVTQLKGTYPHGIGEMPLNIEVTSPTAHM